MDDLIKSYKDLKSLSKICKELNISYANLIRNRVAKEKKEKIKQEIKLEFIKVLKTLIEKENINGN